MSAGSSASVVKVAQENKNRLQELKKTLRLSSVNEVITALLALYDGNERGQGAEVRARRAQAVQAEPVPDRFSYVGFARKPKVREYFCGLPDNGFTRLYQQLRPQVCLAFAGGGCVCGFFFVVVLQLRLTCAGAALDASLCPRTLTLLFLLSVWPNLWYGGRIDPGPPYRCQLG